MADSLADILKDLATTGREGTVVVADGETRKSIYFSRTGVRLVTSGRRRGVRIGEVLLKTGKITSRQLELVLEKQQKSNLRFGELLYLMCMITEDDIRQAVRTQIAEEIYDLFTWNGASVQFTEGPPPPELIDPEQPITNLTFNVSALLEEAGRRLKEWQAWRDKLPPRNLALRKAEARPGRSELPLDDRVLAVLQLCDGRRGLEQVVEASPMFRFETLKAVAFLLSGDRILAEGPAIPDPPTTEQLMRPVSRPPRPASTPPTTHPMAPASNNDLGALNAGVKKAPGAAPRDPSTKFGLEAVPEVDWKEKDTTGARKPTEPPGSPSPPTYEPIPDVHGLPPAPFKKEETSRLMVRAAAVAARNVPLPPLDLPRRRGGRLGWAVAVLLVLAAAGGAVYEIAARNRLREASAKARAFAEAGDRAGARRVYGEVAEEWRWSGAAAAARAAMEALAPERPAEEAAARLRDLARRGFGRAKGLTLEEESAARLEAESWARENGDGEMEEWCRAWGKEIAAYRSGAEAAFTEYEKARGSGEVERAHEWARKIRADFARAPEASRVKLPVRVETVPSGAALRLDGAPAGNAPATIEVPFGTAVLLAAEHPGHEPGAVLLRDTCSPLARLDLLRLPRWTSRLSGGVSRAPAGGAAAVFAVSDDGAIAAVALSDGHMLWRARPSAYPLVTGPVVARGVIVAGGQDGSLWAFDAGEGTSLWHEPAGAALRGPLAPSPDGAHVFASTEGNTIAAFEAATGKELGRVALPTAVLHGPWTGAGGWIAVLADGNVVRGTPEGMTWGGKAPSAPSFSAPVPGGVLAAAPDGALALVAGEASPRWTARLEGGAPGAIAADADRAVVAVGKRRCAALSLADGKVLWAADVPADLVGAPVLSAGRVLLACDDGLLRFLDAADGRPAGSSRAPDRTRAVLSLGREGAIFGGESGALWLVP